jgi:MFS family permease
MRHPPLTGDARRILAAQALRAFSYGFGAVLLGATLHERHFSTTQVGMVLAAVVAGTAVMSVVLARWGDHIGRRRFYAALYVLLAVTGATFALSDRLWLLIVVALSGALSTEVVESGPFTSLEQAMLATDLSGAERLRGFGIYNAVATAAGALGALAAALPSVARSLWAGAPADAIWFWLLVPAAGAGALVAWSLSPAVESAHTPGQRPPGLSRSRPVVRRLASLFALDSFGGGFVVQAFIAYWLATRFGASTETIGLVFFAVAVLQTASFLTAPHLAQRFGLLRTMVFTHLPSNAFLALIPLAPTLTTAVGALLVRTVLSQMDVPTRQAYVMALVEPTERTAAAAYTNTARYLTRPVGPILAGAASSFALGAPFVIAGAIKIVYDVVLWRWFSTVAVPDEAVRPRASVAKPGGGAVSKEQP